MTLPQDEDPASLQALATVGGLMTRNPVSLEPEQRVSEAINLFTERRFRHLLVVSGHVLAGVLSDRDVLRLLARRPGAVDTPVADVMTRDPLTIGPECSVAEAIELLLVKQINCLPVVADDRTVQGILTTSDLLRALHATAAWLDRQARAR